MVTCDVLIVPCTTHWLEYCLGTHISMYNILKPPHIRRFYFTLHLLVIFIISTPDLLLKNPNFSHVVEKKIENC